MKRVFVLWLLIAGIVLSAEREEQKAEQIKEKLKQERGRLEKLRAGRRPGMAFAGRRRAWRYPFRRQHFNVIDEARFTMAKLYCEVGKPEEAVKTLQAIVEESPDEEAKSEAHFRLGNIHSDFFSDKEKAIEQYTQVRGVRRTEALQSIVSLFKKDVGSGEAIKKLMGIVDRVEQKKDKVTLLREIASLYSSWGSKEKAVEVLKKIPEVITYEEAEKLKRETKPAPRVFFGRGLINRGAGKKGE